MVIVEDGEPCQGACTGRGHVEAYCSGRAADKLAQRGARRRARRARARRRASPGAGGDRPPSRRRDRIAREHLRRRAGRDRRRLRRRRGLAADPGRASPRCATRRSRRPGEELEIELAVARRGGRADRRRPRRVRRARVAGSRRCRSRSARRRSGTSTTSRCACSPSSATADLVLAEDTRHTRGLLERHGIRARLLSYHEHNEAARVAELLPRLAAGERIALVSDAGLPRRLRSGHAPGARRARRRLEVTVLPGPSAVETALVASGLGGGAYAFVGFLPRGKAALAALWQETAAWGTTVVAFESPQRLPATLRSLARRRARARGRGLPRADEAVRGGRARHRRASSPSGSPSRRKGRSRSSSRGSHGAPAARICRAARGRRASSSPRERRDAWRPRSSPG